MLFKKIYETDTKENTKILPYNYLFTDVYQ